MGQFERYYITKYLRVLQLFVLITLHLALNGAFLAILDDVDEEKENVDADVYADYMLAILASVLISLAVTIVFELLVVRKSMILDLLSWILMGILGAASLAGTVAMSVEYCGEWHFVWCLLFVVSFAFDLLVVQSMIAISKTIMLRRLNN